MGDVFAHARAEDQADALLCGAAQEDARGGGVEVSAAGEADDVVEEAQRAGGRAVLVVDVAVEVSTVGRGYETGGGVEVVFSPGAHFKVGIGIDLGGGDTDEQIAAHEEALVNAEAGRGEGVR